MTREGGHTLSVALFSRVVVLSVVLLSRHELRAVEFILVQQQLLLIELLADRIEADADVHLRIEVVLSAQSD